MFIIPPSESCSNKEVTCEFVSAYGIDSSAVINNQEYCFWLLLELVSSGHFLMYPSSAKPC